MFSMLSLQVGVMQIGTHVGVHLDFVCPDLQVASSLHQEMLIKAEAAKLLATLGFDTEALGDLFKVDEYGTSNEIE